MKQCFCLAVLNILASLVAGLRVWPEPLDVTTGDGVVWHKRNLQVVLRCGLDSDVSISFSKNVEEPNPLLGFAHSFWGISQLFLSSNTTAQDSRDVLSEAKIFRGAVRRTLQFLDDMNFVPWKFHPRRSDYEPDIDSDDHSVVESFVITQTRCPSDKDVLPVDFFSGDESYQIEISDGRALISSNDTLGSLWALQSVSQLFYAHSSGKGVYLPSDTVKIIDSPKWPHRGLLVDIARNAFMPNDLLKVIGESLRFLRSAFNASKRRGYL